MSNSEIFQKIQDVINKKLSNLEPAEKSIFLGHYLFRLDEDSFIVWVKNESLVILQNDIKDIDVKSIISSSRSTFIKILQGKLDPRLAFLRSKISFKRIT